MNYVGYVLAAICFIIMAVSSSKTKGRLDYLNKFYAKKHRELVRQANEKTVQNNKEQHKRKVAAEAVDKVNSDLFTELDKLKKEYAPLGPRADSLIGKIQNINEKIKLDEGVVDFASETLNTAQNETNKYLKQKRELIKEYQKRFRKLERQYQSILATPRATQLRGFAQKYRYTPFGPCSLFALCEALYKEGEEDRALREYKTLIKLFPDSEYADAAQQQIGSLESKSEYNSHSISMDIYYKRLQIKE